MYYYSLNLCWLTTNTVWCIHDIGDMACTTRLMVKYCLMKS